MLWQRSRSGIALMALELFPTGLCDVAAVWSLRVPVRPLRLISRLAVFAVSVLAGSAHAGTMRHDVDPARYTALAADPLYQSVGLMEVAIFEEGQPAAGSGTLVASDWVLTAAHVVQGGKAINFTVGGQTYAASRWVSHPKFVSQNLLLGTDLALVQLSRPVADVMPAKLYRKKKEIRSLGTFAGFGLSGSGLDDGTTDRLVDDRLKRAGTNIIDGQIKIDRRGSVKVIDKLNSTAKTFAVDFDAPANPLESRMGSDVPTELEFLISKGDSGGGAFIDDPNDLNGPLLAGVHSFGQIFDERDDSDYGDLTGHTRVSMFKNWIDKAITSPRFQRGLNFVTPSQVITPSSLDPMARSIPATGVPEPTALVLFGVIPLLMLRRPRRQRD